MRTKLAVGSTAALVLLTLLTVIHIRTSSLQRATADRVYHTYRVLRATQAVQGGLSTLEHLANVEPSPSERAELAGARDTFRVEVQALIEEVADWPAERKLLAPILAGIETLLDSEEADPDSPAAAGGGLVNPSIHADVARFVKYTEDLLALRLAANERARLWNQVLLPVGSTTTLLLTFWAAWWLAQAVARPLRELTEAMERLQNGDLAARVPVRGPVDDELGRLSRGFNAMAADLAKRDVQASILRVAELLATTGELAPLLDSALGRLLDVVACPAGAIYLRMPEDESLRVMVSAGTGPGLIDQVIRPGEGIVGRAAQGRSPMFLPADADSAPLTIHHWIGEQRPAELAYVPLTSGPRLVGVLALAATHPFEDRNRNLLRIVAGQLGAAIENALSHQALQRQAVELEARNTRLAEKRRQIELQNAELLQASRLKSEFLANMSHELRTPLTIILGFTNTVLRGAQGPLGSEQAESLRRVYDNAKQLLNLINDILDLSKIEAGQMELEPSPTAVRGLLEAVADGFRTLAAQKGLALAVDVDPALPDSVLTDETRLRQILTNLLSNAVKFTDHGEVCLRARRAEPAVLEVEVRDTGPGIAEADIPKIFEQFRQLDGRTNRKAGGTGLGLSIVRRLVDLLGGALDVSSRVGQGTSFLLRLPLDPSAAPAIPAEGRARARSPIAEGRLGGRTLLAIDDDTDFLALLRASLADLPLRLEVADSGRSGLQKARDIRPDVITLDIQMPGMDGWAVLNELKSDPSTAEIPIILLSILQRRGLGILLGAADYLTKPLDRDRLIQALRRVGARSDGSPVLIVDDDPDIRRLLSGDLEAQGFRVVTAHDGLEGVRLALRERPSLVILDLMMPNLDGFEVVARLQQHERTRTVPIVVLTAKDLTSEDRRRLHGRIEEVLQKGAQPLESLVSRLVQILDSIGLIAPKPAEAPAHAGQ